MTRKTLDWEIQGKLRTKKDQENFGIEKIKGKLWTKDDKKTLDQERQGKLWTRKDKENFGLRK